MNRRALLKSGLLFVVTAVGLIVAVDHFAAPLLDFLLPGYRVEMQWLLPDFHIDRLTWRIDHQETVVALSATTRTLRVVLDRIIPAGVSISASTLAAHAWAPPVLMLALVASWPGIRLMHRPLILLLTLPFAGLAMVIQVPLMLWGAVEDVLYWQVDPSRVAESFGSRVQGFLDGGGRYAIALVLAFLVMALFRIMVPENRELPVASAPTREPKQRRPRAR